MLLGCSINIFDGLELLPFSLRNLRNSADFISVVYQDVSNFGNKSKIEILPILDIMKSDGLIDRIIKYVPQENAGHSNEIRKRNIGLESCISAGMSHFMTMDCDEFYVKSQLDEAKKTIEKCAFETTACQMQTYWKTPEWALFPPETYFVPFISKLDGRRFKLGTSWPVVADPTRRLEANKFYAFKPTEIEMHHFSYVRSDIRAKLYNSSANTNWSHKIERLAEYHDNWHPGKKALLAGKEERFYELRLADNLFGINI